MIKNTTHAGFHDYLVSVCSPMLDRLSSRWKVILSARGRVVLTVGHAGALCPQTRCRPLEKRGHFRGCSRDTRAKYLLSTATTHVTRSFIQLFAFTTTRRRVGLRFRQSQRVSVGWQVWSDACLNVRWLCFPSAFRGQRPS